MGKAEVGTPKYIANKMKAKGLQKLRWYCQMCQKQCRDENGFKCHITSESHQRQLLLFADNSKKYMDEFSHEFASGYLELLKRQFGTKRVPANRVYQEYISDRNHLHMNATRWVTLTGFVKWLGREGKCVVDETEKGWFITYIDRDPETIALQEKLQRKEKMEKDDQERMMAFLEKQMKKDKKRLANEPKNPEEPECTTSINLEDNDREKVTLNIPSVKPKLTVLPSTIKSEFSSSKRKNECEDNDKKKHRVEIKPKKSALDEIIAAKEEARERDNRRDYWMTDGIVVKVVTKTIGEEFYKKKGVVREVHDRYVATVSMLDSKKKVKIDQADLETVIPAIGRQIKIVNGAYRGSKAILLKVNENTFSVSVEIDSGPLKGRKVNNIQYEDISKLHTDS